MIWFLDRYLEELQQIGFLVTSQSRPQQSWISTCAQFEYAHDMREEDKGS